MARRGNDIPETLVHVLSVATSVSVATGAGCTEHQVREKLRHGELYEDWEDSPAVLRSTARRVRAELIAKREASRLAGIAANAEVDEANRKARAESAAAGRRQRENAYFGTRVSVPGEAPREPWVDLPSSGDDE
jgi:hypothetical protein